MTTRQHLIEQDCMDKLGWDIHQVAVSSDEDMIRALCEHENIEKQTTTISEHTYDADTHHVNKSDSVSELNMVRTIRNHILQKNEFLTSGQCMPDDAEILKSSILEDQEYMENLVSRLKVILESKMMEHTKRSKLYNLLRKLSINTVGSKDTEHMKTLEKVLRKLSSDIDELKSVISN